MLLAVTSLWGLACQGLLRARTPPSSAFSARPGQRLRLGIILVLEGDEQGVEVLLDGARLMHVVATDLLPNHLRAAFLRVSQNAQDELLELLWHGHVGVCFVVLRRVRGGSVDNWCGVLGG